ncbi:MAG: dipeptidase [Proteobacteria bacterium]|jgi:acetylornithine deacetylase/succinyl-diaminopimelate desuccinylase-like protein|nr:dipeptidase [Pseudomonadota bacterium]
MSIEAVLEYLSENQDRHAEQLCDLLRIPSVSAISDHKPDVLKAAKFLVDELNTLGILSVELIETNDNPLVYAQTEIRDDRPTLLFYGHYDVQPAVKEDGWDTEPFEPTIRDGIIYARGGSDDKGQLYAHLKALEAYVKTNTPVPVNLKFIFEGEEECGGHSIYEFTENNPEKLATDVIIVSDTSFYDGETPAISYSLRGMAFMEIRIQGPDKDLHSGSWGGTVKNPANALCEIIAQLVDDDGHVLIPGFYDDVMTIDDAQREAFAKLDFPVAALLEETGSPIPYGEKGYGHLERMWVRPTCDVNGLGSGYSGEGAKTIIPSRAIAKVSMRLVPHQNPDEIAASFTAFVKSIAPEGVVVEVENLHNAEPVLVPRDNAMVQAGMSAMERGFGKRPVFIGEGGSIPIVGTFQDCLKAPVVLLGYGLPDDHIHSMNEKFHLEQFWKGARTTAHMFQTVVEQN